MQCIHGTLGFLQVFTCAKQFLFVGIVHGPVRLFSVRFQLLGEKQMTSIRSLRASHQALINITLTDHNGGIRVPTTKANQAEENWWFRAFMFFIIGVQYKFIQMSSSHKASSSINCTIPANSSSERSSSRHAKETQVWASRSFVKAPPITRMSAIDAAIAGLNLRMRCKRACHIRHCPFDCSIRKRKPSSLRLGPVDGKCDIIGDNE